MTLKKEENMNKLFTEKNTVAAVLIMGILASLMQFICNRSMYGDEVLLAFNIWQKNSFELLQPLDYAQVAPILFLQIEKVFSMILPNSEYGLRLFPLLCFWGSIYFFYQIVGKLFNNVFALIIALSFFCFGHIFIYYSSEVKQYMSDVFVLLCIFYFLLKDYKKDATRYYLLGIIGVLAIFLSNVAPVILFTCGLYLSYEYFFHKKTKILPLSIVFSVWLIVFLLYYRFFIYEHPLRDVMNNYWSPRNGFLPLNPTKASFFLIKSVPRIFSPLFFMHFEQSPWIRRIAVCCMVLFFITGIIKLIRNKQTGQIILLCTPLLLHLILSAFHLYPFESRLILYAIPGIIIVCSLEVCCVANNIFKINESIKIKQYFMIIPLLFLLFLFSDFPVKTQDVKGCIKYVQKNSEAEGNNIYVGYSQTVAFKYYNDVGFVDSKWKIINRCNIERYLETYETWMTNPEQAYIDDYDMNELKMLHNKNWVLTSSQKGKEMISKLDSLGYNRVKEFQSKGSSVYLYDFGE
jgi:hypothetical protein